MTDIIKYTYSVRDVNHRYQMIHNDVFGLSVRKLAAAMVKGQSASLTQHDDELKMLQEKLTNIQTALGTIPQSELKIRRGREILLTLSKYVAALSKSINYLKKICHDKNSLPGSDSKLVNDRKLYDDAIQHHKTLGVKLNGLLSSF